ncbi:MAG: hypothetical protein NTV34_03630 [Proteobacteria bacterium]|nr:hypothetical protein [Pseudomonadota bacterium]
MKSNLHKSIIFPTVIFGCLFTTMSLGSSLPSGEAPPAPLEPPSDRLWTIGIGMERIYLKGQSDHNILGLSGGVGFGMSWFAQEDLMLTGTVDIHQGPWGRIRNGTFNADFSGAAGSVEATYCFLQRTCRLGAPTLALGVALSSLDISGKSIGPHRKDTGDPKDKNNEFLEQQYKLSANGFLVAPSLALVNLKAPRPSGNTSELLTTRIEGRAVRLGIAVPFLMKYRAVYIVREDLQEASQEPSEHVVKGFLKGYSIFASFQTWLGT